MEISNVVLSQEVYRSDAERILDWLGDEEIVGYLNEDYNARENLINVINRVNMPILTHLFNNNCRFYTIKNEYGTLGFIRLIPKGDALEMVIAVGEKNLWGKGIGHQAVKEALKEAFFEMRTKKVIIKIKKNNKRSQNLAKGLGFKQVRIMDNSIEYLLSIDEFCRQVA
ncbi:MAG: GNAT family N-acetyltransferase [Clostridium sp.]|nr:GNAT family N-acetyltransferase [Clostridium sp.]